MKKLCTSSFEFVNKDVKTHIYSEPVAKILNIAFRGENNLHTIRSDDDKSAICIYLPAYGLQYINVLCSVLCNALQRVCNAY